MLTKFLLGTIGTVFVICLIIGGAVLMAYPVKWLVNYVFTDGVRLALFGVVKISVWKAFFLNMLCGFLFKSTASVSSK